MTTHWENIDNNILMLYCYEYYGLLTKSCGFPLFKREFFPLCRVYAIEWRYGFEILPTCYLLIILQSHQVYDIYRRNIFVKWNKEGYVYTSGVKNARGVLGLKYDEFLIS